MKYFSFIIDIIIKEEVMEGGVTPVLEQGEIFDPDEFLATLTSIPPSSPKKPCEPFSPFPQEIRGHYLTIEKVKISS